MVEYATGSLRTAIMCLTVSTIILEYLSLSISESVSNFFFSEDGKRMAVQKKTDSGWSLTLFDFEKNSETELIRSENISKNTTDFITAIMPPDLKKLFIEIRENKKSKFYLLATDRPGNFTSLAFLGNDFGEIYFNQQNPQKLFLLKKMEVREVNLALSSISSPLLKNVAALKTRANNVYYLDGDGFLYRTDYSLSPGSKINDVPITLDKNVSHQLEVFPAGFILKEADALYYLDENAKIFKKLTDAVNNFRISHDAEKLAYWNNSEIWVFFFKDKNDQPTKKMYDKSFVTRFSGKIEDVFWYTDHYLIFVSGNKIKISEIDDRDSLNIFDLADFQSPKIVWDKYRSLLYVFTQDNLFLSDKLIK